MKRPLLFALPLLLIGAPAFATGGFHCQTTDGSNLAISGSVGHVVGFPLLGATLHLGERTLATTDEPPQISIGRSWLDDREIRVDLIDSNAERYEAQLRVRVTRDGTARGTLVREGRTHRVQCELE
jgi:hypothetical protein